MKRLYRLIRRSDGFWVTVVILGTFLAGAVLVLVAVQKEGFRNWLIGNESGSATIRNIGLLVGGIVAIALAVWRSRVAERQAAIAQQQAEIAQNQAATAERGLLNERYQRGAEMLGSDVLTVRLGGIYALQRVAAEHPEEYHVQIMKLFCEVVRNPTSDKNMPVNPNASISEDVQAIMDAIGARSERQIQVGRDSGYTLNLSHANLRNAGLRNADLRGVDLSFSKVTPSWMDGANLTGVLFFGTDLSSANLNEANFHRATLVMAILTGAKFSLAGKFPAKGLTQTEIDTARADPDDPPKLEGVVDAEKHVQLEWRGHTLPDYANEVG